MNASQWLEVSFSYTVQVTLVIAIAYLLDRSVDNTRIRSSIWSTLYWSVLALGFCAVTLPRLHLVQPWARLSPGTALSVAEVQAVIGKTLLPIWALGVCVALVRWLARGYLLQCILRRCEQVSTDESQRILSLSAHRVAPRRKPRILISDDVDSPFCWQLHEPTIVLPRFLLEGSEEDLMHVVVHELEHLNTHHPLQLFLQHTVEVICWFHPAVWRASRHASLVREFVCDDATLSSGANTVAYLRTLLRIAERSEANNVTLGFGRNRSEVIIRTRRMVGKKQSESANGGQFRRFGVVATMFFATFLSSQLWLPVDALASPRSNWSPWPTWSATTLHCFGVTARDYEIFDHRVSIHELREDHDEVSAVSALHR